MAEWFSLSRSLTIEWKVKNIFALDSLESKVFRFSESRCNLALLRDGTGGYERIVIVLVRRNSNKMPFNRITAQMCIKDRSQNSQFSKLTIDCCETNCMIWLGSVSGLRAKGDAIFTNGFVTFVCELREEGTSEVKIEKDAPAQIDVNSQSVANWECLSFDFRHLLNDSILPDITLKCGNSSILAHRSILSARSEVFLAMFFSDMAESRTGIIEISDMEPSTLDQLLQYIYSGRVVGLSAESAQQLYAAADKYAIDSLKMLCGEFMKEILTEENACSFLVFADARGVKDLKDYVLSFVVNTDLLWDKDKWLWFHEKYPQLAAEALHHVYRAKCTPNSRINRIFPN